MATSPSNSGKRAGFTLIELLIVIGIIVILAAILAPVGAKALDRGKQLKCANNIRQLHLATTLYSQDNEGKLPNCTGANYSWVTKIAPYVERVVQDNGGRRRGVFACPMSKNSDGAGEYADYAKNYYTGGGDPQQYNDKQHHTDLRLLSVAQPSQVIFIADSDDRDLDYQTQSVKSDGVIKTSRIVFRHGAKGVKGMANVMFLDGHLEAMQPTDARFNVTGSPWYKFPYNPTPDS